MGNYMMHADNRGTLTEFVPQVFVARSYPGVTRGDHYHNRKVEQFLVVSGQATIRLRRRFSNDVLAHDVRGSQPRAINIPAGYVHNITNTGDTDMVFVAWSSESFDPNNTDTYPETV